MTTRRWMIAVAVLGVVLAAGAELIRLNRAAFSFQGRAAHHATQQSLSEVLLSRSRAEAVEFRRIYAEMRQEMSRAEVDKLETEMTEGRRGEERKLIEKIDYHSRMKRKYLAAARNPWRRVLPDPPPPN